MANKIEKVEDTAAIKRQYGDITPTRKRQALFASHTNKVKGLKELRRKRSLSKLLNDLV